MELKIKKAEYYEVNDSDLNAFIKEQYGQEYDFASCEEAIADNSRIFSVKSGNLYPNDLSKLKDFKSTGRCNYFTDILLMDLCNRGLIEPGEYLIRVSW
jgi:hypothetical protein